jgi:hypothetical protein
MNEVCWPPLGLSKRVLSRERVESVVTADTEASSRFDEAPSHFKRWAK